jgi:uncharacterized membrane protein
MAIIMEFSYSYDETGRHETITFNGREITKQPARAFALAVTYTMSALAIVIAVMLQVASILLVVFALFALAALSPIWVPLDFVLKARGRAGFYHSGDLEFSPKSFRRR